MSYITKEEAMEDLGTRKHQISEGKAAAMIKKYRFFRTRLLKVNWLWQTPPPDMPLAVTYNKQAIEGLLKLPGFYGLRILPAINSDNALTFVLVGIDAEGNTISNRQAKGGTVVDEGQMSPPYPKP